MRPDTVDVLNTVLRAGHATGPFRRFSCAVVADDLELFALLPGTLVHEVLSALEGLLGAGTLASSATAVEAAMIDLAQALRVRATQAIDDYWTALQRDIEVRHGYYIDANEALTVPLRQRLTIAMQEAARLATCIARGEQFIETALPRADQLFPLPALRGTTPLQRLDMWRAARTRPRKTQLKFEGVARDIESLLGGLPLEALTRAHLEAYDDYLFARRNAPTTADNKFAVLHALIGNLRLTTDARSALRCMTAPASSTPVTPRPAFKTPEFHELIRSVWRDRGERADDWVVTALKFLTAARLEEVASLTSEQLSIKGRFVYVRYYGRRRWTNKIQRWRNGVTPSQGKTASSERVVPVFAASVPGLHERLVELSRRPGRLFPDYAASSVTGTVGNALSKRVNRRIKRLFGGARGLVFESLRKTAVARLRHAGIDPVVRRQFLGHAATTIHDKHYEAGTADDEDLECAALVLAEALKGAVSGPES